MYIFQTFLIDILFFLKSPTLYYWYVRLRLPVNSVRILFNVSQAAFIPVMSGLISCFGPFFFIVQRMRPFEIVGSWTLVYLRVGIVLLVFPCRSDAIGLKTSVSVLCLLGLITLYKSTTGKHLKRQRVKVQKGHQTLTFSLLKSVFGMNTTEEE